MTETQAGLADSDPGENNSADGLLAPIEEHLTKSPSLAMVATRISGTWVGIIIGSLVLALLLVFVLQNTRSVKVSLFTASGELPLGVALLFAAVGGVLLAAVAASLRIVQLRRRMNNSDRNALDQPAPARASTDAS
ncbi:MAG: lipopolysaccharide assembly protein LapA domain-containing protein [Acidimicrobiales bacterium]|jgi:uncharacterized integral membrane protein